MRANAMTIVIAVLVVLAVLALGVVLLAALRDRRSQRLRSRFGPEYDRAVAEAGSQKHAEEMLEQRVVRRRDMDIRELDSDEREGYSKAWRGVQGRFVDDPRGALADADTLIVTVMRDRGYPTEDFEQQAADASVDHAGVIPSYRRAHEVALAGDQAGTDELRRAMVLYRELFMRLIGEPAAAAEAR